MTTGNRGAEWLDVFLKHGSVVMPSVPVVTGAPEVMVEPGMAWPARASPSGEARTGQVGHRRRRGSFIECLCALQDQRMNQMNRMNK